MFANFERDNSKVFRSIYSIKMTTRPNPLPQISADAQANNTTATATGERINQELNEYVIPAYDSSKNCETYLSSISPDDKQYIQVLLVMCHPFDNEIQKRIDNLIEIKVFSKNTVRQTSERFIAEVRRRAGWLKLQNVRPKSWRKSISESATR